MHNATAIINDLIAACRDSEEGFGKAAKGAHSDDLRTQLTRAAQIRAQFADQLQAEAEPLGIKPETTGHIGEILHRGWVDLETRIRPKTDQHLVEDCRAGEEATFKHYERALADPDLPPTLRSLLERQLGALHETLDALPGVPTPNA